MSGPDDSLSDDLTMELPPSVQLPPADLGSLPELDMAIRNLSQSPAGRDALAKTIMSEDYISKLIPLVEMAEDLESLPDLHRLCNIMKTVLLLNDTSIIEHAVSDECVLGVVGALEYDPDFPSHKANHRQWLNNQGRYKEVVRIQDEHVRRKIHITYRLQYLKDVVLARILDDPTFSVLNSLIFFNQVDIVQHLHTTPGFMMDLFAIFHDPHQQPLRKKEAVLFIQQCCAIAKNLQPPARQGLYVHFLKEGLLPAINFGMRHRDVSVRVGATDILVSMIDHDPSLVRQTIYEQIQKRLQPLTDTLIDLLLVEVDLGVKSQISEALKVLLDPCPPPVQQQQQQQQQQQESRGEFSGQPRLRVHPGIDPQQDAFLTHFYEHSAVRLFKPLLELEKRTEMKFSPSEQGVFSYLNDILCFYVQRHHHRSKFFVFTYNMASRLVQLLACKEKHLQLVAVRFFRHLVIMQDEFYVNHMVDKQVLGPILDVLLRTLPRDNLLSSACLELFMLVSKENIKELIKQMVENYREKVMALAYIPTFSEILHRYDQTQGFTINIDPYFESEDEVGRGRPPNGAARGMMEHISVDQAQEDYWNTSDDEEDFTSQHPSAEELQRSLDMMADRSPSKPLVEYTSDEEVDENDAVMTNLPTGPTTGPSPSDESTPSPTPSSPASAPTNGTSPSASATAAAAAAATAPPPERLSEKRRREEDDDDDALDKLTQHKRRNSSSAASNAALPVSTAILRKKRSFTGHGHGASTTSTGGGSPKGGGAGGGGLKKIAISISQAAKAAVVKADEGGGGDGSGRE
jgi:protein phosphatase-4 regulatory subunit 3